MDGPQDADCRREDTGAEREGPTRTPEAKDSGAEQLKATRQRPGRLFLRAILGSEGPGPIGSQGGLGQGWPAMTDLQRFGAVMLGIPVAVVVCGVALGLIGSWLKKSRQ